MSVYSSFSRSIIVLSVHIELSHTSGYTTSGSYLPANEYLLAFASSTKFWPKSKFRPDLRVPEQLRQWVFRATEPRDTGFPATFTKKKVVRNHPRLKKIDIRKKMPGRILKNLRFSEKSSKFWPFRNFDRSKFRKIPRNHRENSAGGPEKYILPKLNCPASGSNMIADHPSDVSYRKSSKSWFWPKS